jgi:hypothetical protein
MGLGNRTPLDVKFWLAVCQDSKFLLVSLYCFSICFTFFFSSSSAGRRQASEKHTCDSDDWCPDHVSITNLILVSAASTIAISNQSVVRHRVGEPFLKFEPFHVASTFAAGTSCCDELCQNLPDEHRRWVVRSQTRSVVSLHHFPISLVLQNEALVVGEEKIEE